MAEELLQTFDHYLPADAFTRPSGDGIQAGRAEVIEECAKVADAVAGDGGEQAARGYLTIEERIARNTGRRIAVGIRALNGGKNG